MNTKNLLAVITTLTMALNATAEDGKGDYRGKDYGYGSQQVVVNNYYTDNGYEYASRLKRFHNSYSSFDFYSPVYTETYWYNFTPYTWGVSIYDDWYYYGAGVSRYSWRSGFGGSYWWGYDPWMDYDPWMGYGWNSWNSPGFSYSINIYLGRPQYHYPVAWNRWNHHQHWDSYRPVYIVNNNNYYNSYNNNNNTGYGRGYNPSRPNIPDRRPGYTVTSGRSTGSNYSRPEETATRSNGTFTRSDQGTRNNTGRSDTQGNNTGQGNSGKDKSNNGLRMGQYRRGVAEPTEAKPNEPDRPNNPNVNDRTDPGREKAGMRAPVQTQSRQQTQGAVRTSTNRRETNVSQGTSRSTPQPKETTTRKSTEKASGESTAKTTSKTETGRRSSTSSKKR
ncbi:MAG TPA: hypothetical protein VMV74_03775 [Bacteroidales bacterium]|nr:hypothetical protein [Bacteroidales bacterium]